MLTLPEWACKEENYKASKDNDYFITKSLLGIIRILRQLKFQSKAKIPLFSSVGPAILTSIIIILCACSHKSAYLLCISALLLIILSFLDGKSIYRLLKHTVTVTFLSSLLLLPAIYFYQNSFIILIPVKTFLIILSISLLTTYCNWHSILGVMNKFHVPSIIVFIFDTTLRYIVLLGETAQQILYALKIRSIGKNNNKSKAFGGVMGVVFQLPVIAYFMAKLGIIESEMLVKYRQYAFLIIMIVAAIITPPDLMTLVLVTIPLYLLYEISIIVIRRVKSI